MNLSWNEIRERAAKFVVTWSKAEGKERSEAQTFWEDFFQVFGVNRRSIGLYEMAVKMDKNAQGFIDFFWKKNLIGEMKSRGGDLDKALSQAYKYAISVPRSVQPKYILACNFGEFLIYDVVKKEERRFTLEEFPNNLDVFGFITGYKTVVNAVENSVDIESAEMLGKLYDELKSAKYKQHDTNVFMVRVLYCLYADDAGIWQKNLFCDYIKYRTAVDGTDLDAKLSKLFSILDTASCDRYARLDESLASFPYVNGALYKEQLPIPSFDKVARTTLLECCHHDWSKVNPSIFGSIFQSIMNPEERRTLGAHYTSELNIMKVINPLFMDELRAELGTIKNNGSKLEAFHNKIASLKFLDPACGCGNFLVIAYSEMRNLELEVLKMKKGLFNFNKPVAEMVRVNIDQFYGIEIDEWPARIANVSMWIQDHKSNVEASQVFGETRPSIPLKECAHIKRANALRVDWPSVDYIFGNLPFVGSKKRNAEQKVDFDAVMSKIKGGGNLDFVAAWFKLALSHVRKGTKAAFVSTNSITQGEQSGIMGRMFEDIQIRFAYPTFPWTSDIRGKAAVHCVIIGFDSDSDPKGERTIYEGGFSRKVSGITWYLTSGQPVSISRATKPVSANSPFMHFGSMPNDGGHLILSNIERAEFLKRGVPENWIRPFVGSEEFINGKQRYCLWLKDVPAQDMRKHQLVMNRLELVKDHRSKSTNVTAVAAARTPYLFYADNQPSSDYLLVPGVSSEKRDYIPIGFVTADKIARDKNYVVPNATPYHFGILTSQTHMAWMRAVCGRLESRYSYSNTVVYNNFIWPKTTKEQQASITKLANAVLETRKNYPNSTLADLYDPKTMPSDLLKAHKSLDKAVDQLYRKNGFESDEQRVAHLFKLYAKATKGEVK